MQVTVTSTTDNPEAVIAAQGGLVQDKVENTPAPATKEASEKPPEESEPSEELEGEEADQDDKETKPEDRPKRKGGFKKRIAKLTARATALEQEREYWRQEALKTRAPEEPKKPDVAKAADGKPTAEQFETHEDYVEALADWKVDQKLSARDAKTKESEVKSDMAKKTSSHIERVKAFAADHSDFNELMEDVDDIPMSLTVQQVILDSDNGPELMYALAKNREEYERICKLPAIAAARELGRFEAKLNSSDSKETQEQKTTKAPKPISPVNAKGGGAASSKSPDAMDFDEYKAWRAKHPKG